MGGVMLFRVRVIVFCRFSVLKLGWNDGFLKVLLICSGECSVRMLMFFGCGCSSRFSCFCFRLIVFLLMIRVLVVFSVSVCECIMLLFMLKLLNL